MWKSCRKTNVSLINNYCLLLCIVVDFTVVDQLMEQNFPMSIGRVADPTACWLVQDGYITLYSPKRKSPIFTSERLEEDIIQKV